MKELWSASVGIVSVVLALALPTHVAGLSGYVYFAVPIIATVVGTRYGRNIPEARHHLDHLKAAT